MADRVEREVLRLTTESAQFFNDLDKAIRKGGELTASFQKSAAGARGLSAEWRAFSRTLESTQTPMGRMQGGLSSSIGLVRNFAGSLGIGVGAGAVISFGKHVLDTASEINDLSDKLGVSAEDVQRFKFAAKQTGAELSNVDTSLTFLNRTLGAGESSTKSLLRSVGLDFEKLRNQKPGQTFLDVLDAIKKIPDPMKQTDAAVKLLGRSGADLLPALREGFADLARQATVSSNESIAALDAFGDRLDKLASDAEAATIQVAGSLVMGLDTWEEFGKTLLASVVGPYGAQLQIQENVAKSLADVAAGHEKAGAAAGKHGDTVTELTDAQKAYQRTVAGMADELSGRKQAQHIAQLADAVLQAGGESKIATPKLRELRKELEEFYLAGVKLPPVLDKIRAGGGVIFDFEITDQSRWRNFTTWIEDLRSAPAVPLYIDFGITDEVRWKNFAQWLEDLKAEPVVPLYVDFGITDEQRWNNFNKWMEELTAPTSKGHPIVEVFASVASEFPKKLGSAILHGQSIRAAFRALAADFGASIGKQFGQSLAQAGSMLSGLMGDLFGMGGALLAPLFDKLVGIGRNDTLKARQELARDRGFDNLNKLLDKLSTEMGPRGKELAFEAANSIGRKDREANERWMEEVLALLDKEKDASEDLFLTWESTVALAKELGVEMTALGKGTQQSALDDIAGKRIKQFKQLQAAGGSVNGILMGMADEFQEVITQALRADLELPASMRDILEPLVKMGVVVDENGQRLTDLSRFKFTRSLPDSIQSLIDKLDEFLERLAKGLPAAMEEGVNGAKRSIRGMWSGGDEDPLASERPFFRDGVTLPRIPVPSFARGTGGSYLEADTLAQIHKNEAITPRGQVPQLASDIAAALDRRGSQRAVTVRAPLVLGSRVVAEAVIEDILRIIEKNDGGGAESGPLTRITDAVGRRLGVV